MKATPKIKRVKLKISENPESVLFGIVAAEPDYKLSLSLNRKLGISLRQISPVIIHDEKDSELTFSRFSDSSSSTDLVYDLISNRSGKNCLIRKLKNIDYIFQVHDTENEADNNQILSLLRETECVTAVFKIDPETIKEKNLQYINH
jgi:hypothetical protein